MPTDSSTLTLTGAYTGEYITIPVQGYIVKGVALYETNKTAEQVEAFGTIGLMAGGTAYENIVAIMASGNIGNWGKLGWSGTMPTERDMFLFAEIIGYTGQTYRLSCVLYKIIASEDGTFRVDP